MNDLGNLLQMIYDLLSGWFNSFTSHAIAVMEKLNLIETDTASIKNSASDIKSNTDDIKDNTGAIVTPVQSIKTNTDSIKTDTTSIKNNVATMTNQLGTISTNVGTASAFTEDVANNTLDIRDRIVTIGSDTTQLRSNSNTITSDVSDIKQALGYYLANTPVTEDAEGSICNFDTDLTDYLQACNVTIPADLTGFSGITLTKYGKNIFNLSERILNQTNSNGNIITPPAYTISNNLISISRSVSQSGRLFFSAQKLVPSTYTVSAIVSTSGTKKIIYSVRNMDTLTDIITMKYLVITDGQKISFDFTITDNCNVAIDIQPQDNNDGTLTIEQLMIEVDDAFTSYEPNKAMTYPVSFGTTITDGAEINLLDGIIKVNSTPVSYLSITPIAIRTYKGINNIYSDIGTTALTYRETLKHYLDKQEA